MAKALNRTRGHEPAHALRPPPEPATKATAATSAAKPTGAASAAKATGAISPARAIRPSGRRVVRTPVVLPGENAPPVRDSGLLRRFLTTLFFLLIVVGMLLLGRYVGAEGRPPAPKPSVAAPIEHAAPPAPRSHPTTSAAPRPEAGTSGQFAYVNGFGPVLGRAGPIHRFRIAVEKPSPAQAGADFAHQVDRTLGDGRSWIASGQFRFQRVPSSAHAEFTVYLASPRTSERMCSTGGLETGGYTSCRLSRKVIINNARWDGAVRDYRAPISTYRQYAINHEVGHQLGHGHEACLGKGRPAPVMMQQTLGLKGCVANAWPYLDGKRYTGPATR
jgi:hypothetical protein